MPSSKSGGQPPRKHLSPHEEEAALRSLTSKKQLTPDLVRELGLEHDLENRTPETKPDHEK